MASFSAPPPYRPNRSAFWQESFYYLNAAAMPVKANSAAITAAMFAYHDGAGLGTSFEFRPFGQANWNAGNSAGYFVDSLPSNLDPATARRTWAANTTVAQQPGTHLYFTDLRQQGATRNALGQYSVVGFGDRHAILWSESSNELMECIGYSGYSAACMHNATFNLASYAMPFATNGTTPAGAIAPRFPVAPLFFTYQDLVDCGTSGNLGHMVGIVLEDYQNQRQWPSRVGDGTQLDGPKSGEVLRLRSDFDLASLPNDMMRALARTLQLHGAILYDRGATPKINTCNDPLWTSAHRASFPFNQFECLDLSSVAGPAHSIRLASNPGGNLLPVPSFTFAPAAGAVPLTVNFNGSASTDPDGSISSYIWAFGDGASGTGATTSHTYSTSGSFSPRLTVVDNLGSSATIAASGWTPSYPLDTPPGKVRFGVATDVGVKAKFEDPISKPVGMFRRFFSWTQATGGSMATEVTTNYAAGRATWLSFKTPVTTTSWADIAAGTYQAQVDAFLVGLRNTGINCWLTPYHEPEDNASPEAPGNGSHLDGTPAQWRAMVRYIEARRKAVNANNVLIVPILMDGTFETGSSRTVSDWILPEADFPLYGFDPYTNGYTTGPAAITATRFNNAVSVMRNTYGKDIAIGEAGGQLGTSNPRPPDLWAAFVQEAIDAEMKAVCWFDNGTNLLNASTADVSGVTYAAVLATFDGSSNYRSGILAAPSAPGSVEVSGSSGPANVAPSAVATVVAASGVAPFATTFSSSGSSDSDGTITGYLWSFGDGTTSTVANPTHTYTSPGTYSVSLRVTDNDGATDVSPLDSVITVVAASTPCDGGGSQDFVTTGSIQTFVVPDGVTELLIDMAGAGGGLPLATITEPRSGGGRTVTTLSVTSGETLYLYVGERGGDASSVPGSGGWPNGGGSLPSTGGTASNQAGGGGGSSEIRLGGSTLSDTVVVAGGGGGRGALGTGATSAGGAGGGLNGGIGGGAADNQGYGGTQDAGGSQGPNTSGVNGSRGFGGAGGGGTAFGVANSGGGGGGGLYGGEGGASTFGSTPGGGGGGGSAYVSPTLCADTVMTSGYNTGDGYISIAWCGEATDPCSAVTPAITAVTGWEPHLPLGSFSAASGDTAAITASAAASGWLEATTYTDPVSSDDTRQAAVVFAVGTCATGGDVSVAFDCRVESIIEDPGYSYIPSSIVAALNVATTPTGSVDTATVTYSEIGNTFSMAVSGSYTADDVDANGYLRVLIATTAYGNVNGVSWRMWGLSASATSCGCSGTVEVDPCVGLDQIPAVLADPVTFTVDGSPVVIEALDGSGGVYGAPGSGLIADGTEHADPAINVAATYGPLAAGTPVHFSVTASLVSPGCTVADDPVVTLVGVIDGVGTALASGSAVDTGGGVWHLSLDHVLAAGWPDVYVIAAVPTGCV